MRKTPDEEVVGIFVAPSPVSLAALVDEHCDPTDCEYAEADAGGLIVPTRTKAKWPLREDRKSDATGLERAVLTQQWEDDLDARTTNLEWMSLAPSAERMLRKLKSKAEEEKSA